MGVSGLWVLELKSATWTVYLPCEKDGTCPLLEYLLEKAGKQGERTLALLREHVPLHGVSRLPSGRSRKLEGCKYPIYEFRWHRKGPDFRVFYLFPKGARKTILCVSAFDKREKTPKTEIQQAEDAYVHIAKAISISSLHVIKLEGE